MFTHPPEILQSVGDLIGLAFRSFRQNISIFIKALLGPVLIYSGGTLSLHWILNYGLPTKNYSTVGVLLCIGLIIISLVIAAVGRFIQTMRQLAFVRLSLGFSPDYKTAYGLIKSRIWLILSVMVIGFIFSFLTAFAAILFFLLISFAIKLNPAAALFAAFLFMVVLFSVIAAAFIIYFSFHMILTVLACEDNEFSSLITRGFSLTWSNLPRCAAFGFLLLICVTLVSYPLVLPKAAISFFETLHKGREVTHGLWHTSMYHSSLYAIIIGQICETAISLLIWPISFLAYGYFYWDLRLRKEGMDILRNVDSLEDQLSQS